MRFIYGKYVHEESLAAFEKNFVSVKCSNEASPGQLLISSHQVCFSSKTLNKFSVQCRAARRPRLLFPRSGVPCLAREAGFRELASHSIQMNCLFGQWDETTLCARLRGDVTRCNSTFENKVARFRGILLRNFFHKVNFERLTQFENYTFFRIRIISSSYEELF